MAGAPAWLPTDFGGAALTSDGGVFKRVLVKGEASGGTPPRGATCLVHYVGTLADGKKFDSSRDRPGHFEFALGLERVILGWDVGVASMHIGEKSIIACRSDYAYGEVGLPPKVPKDVPLFFELELLSWKETRTDRFDLDGDGRLLAAERSKEKGTEAFKLKQYELALDKYSDALYYLEQEEDAFECPTGKEVEASALLVSCLLNAATCTLKLEQYSAAEAHCTKALEQDADSVKALFRRGTARMHQKDLTGAKEDLVKANKLDPKSKEVRDLFNEVVGLQKAAKSSETAMFKNMMKEHKSVQGPMPQPKARTMKVMTPEGVEVEGEVIGDFAI